MRHLFWDSEANKLNLKKSVQFDLFPEMSGGNFNSGAPLYIHGYLEEEGNERACVARAASLSPVAAQTCAHYV